MCEEIKTYNESQTNVKYNKASRIYDIEGCPTITHTERQCHVTRAHDLTLTYRSVLRRTLYALKYNTQHNTI